MNPDLIEYITKITKKRCGSKYQTFSEDIIQEVLIKCIEEKIEDLLLINHWVVYFLNKEKRQSFKKISILPKHDFIEDVSFFDSNKVKDLFIAFIAQTKIKAEHIDLFIKVKFRKMKYKELGVKNENIASVYVWRTYKAFKEYLNSRNIKLIDFYD
jgi:hypothetical protein